MEPDEICVHVVDANGTQVDKVPKATWSRALHEGEIMTLTVEGRVRSFRVLNVRHGEQGGRKVQAVEVAPG